MKTKDYIKTLIERNKTRKVERQKRYVTEEFAVTERDGKIWITHCGIGIKSFENMNTNVVVAELERFRATALEYEKIRTE